MFDAKGVDWKDIPEGEPLFHASADGRGFAVSGGVAEAVVHAVKRIDPDGSKGNECRRSAQLFIIKEHSEYLRIRRLLL